MTPISKKPPLTSRALAARFLFTTRPGRAVAAALVLAWPALSGAADASAVGTVDSNLAACLPRLREEAVRSGVPGPTYDRLVANLRGDASVLPLLDAQPEFRTPIWDYLAALVDEERVRDGQARMAQWRDTLQSASRRFGVDPATVVAVWGVESDYGRSHGKRPLLDSLATLSCGGRRQSYFRGEWFSLMKLIDRGDLDPTAEGGLTGSWAGAFGHTQFMPSTYARLAVDFDGDGRRDLVRSIPDALASTANFLAKAGWRTGLPWGFEVELPDGFDAGLAGRRAKRPLDDWAARGVRRVGGGDLVAGGLAGDTATAVLLPAGPKGPAFVVTRNFDAIYGYNAAESYALAISLLSERLRAGPALKAAWPTDDPGLSRAQRRELQQRLAARGHDIGEIDGAFGPATRKAIVAEQQRLGWPADGRAGQKLLRSLP
jgi:lytic murein transglycosylase